jgi:DNA-binding phage protein
LDEGLPLQSVLAKVIRLYGVKEFAAVVKLPSSNLLRALRPGHNPTLGTLTKLLEPFGLEINIGPVRKKAAA